MILFMSVGTLSDTVLNKLKLNGGKLHKYVTADD